MTGGLAPEGRPRIVVVGYASLDSSTSIREFRGVDATSILDRALVSTEPAVGGIAHLTRAVSATGARADAVSWVGDDRWGRRWAEEVAADGSTVTGVSTAGDRTPSATLIEIAAGGTICLFDPGDCHPDDLSPAQLDVVADADWVLLTVAPRRLTAQLLDALPEHTRLAWAVKHDEDAYTPAIIRRILERADIVSFSRGERDYVTVDGAAPERTVRPGTIVIETRGGDGVVWSETHDGITTRAGSHTADRIEVEDTTGAGDTFIGTLVGLVATAAERDDGRADGVHTVTGLPGADRLGALIAEASTAAGALLHRRTRPGRPAAAPQKETHS